MKLLPSLQREFTLLFRSIYFYVEIIVAVVYLVTLLIVMPEEFDARTTEYLLINVPVEQAAAIEESLISASGDYSVEEVTLKNRGNEISARLFKTDSRYLYAVNNREELIALCEDTGYVGVVMNSPESGLPIEYFLQGNETAKFKDYVLLGLSANPVAVTKTAEKQEVRVLEENPRVLTDRQSVLPFMLTVNCVLMGILAMTAYIVEDKKTKVIKALRVLPARMGVYLTAKMTAVVLTALIICLIIAIPIMKGDANYLLLILTIVSSCFFTVSIGALTASFFDDINKAFAVVFVSMIVLMIPGILSIMPTVNAAWVRFIPSYYAVESIKESLLNRSSGFVMLSCAGFASGGLFLTLIAAKRYKAAGIGVGG